MDNIVATRFTDIKNLPTTTITVIEASHTDPNHVVVRIDYSEWDSATGQEVQKSMTITKTWVLNYRQGLQAERAALTVKFDHLTDFVNVVQPLIDQWLIDNPPEEPVGP